MELSTPHPIIVPAKTTVLLVFMPPVVSRESIGQRASLLRLMELLQQQVGNRVRVLKIDESAHPDVVRSFDVQELPAFVLVQQGVELWRQEGVVSKDDEMTYLPRLIDLIGRY